MSHANESLGTAFPRKREPQIRISLPPPRVELGPIATWHPPHLVHLRTYVVQVASLTLVRFVYSAVTFSSRAQGAAITADDAACGTYPWCCSYRECERSWL